MGYHAFELDLSSLNYQAPSEDLWGQHLRTHQREILATGQSGIEEARLEDYIVSGLIDFDEVSYDNIRCCDRNTGEAEYGGRDDDGADQTLRGRARFRDASGPVRDERCLHAGVVRPRPKLQGFHRLFQ